MTIDSAILGMLSWRPMTGYDMKRMIQDSPVMYWSGNNNQIYKALVQLLDQGFVTNEMKYQESAPNKKIYSITETGRQALDRWIFGTEPEFPEFKKTFLLQLMWAGESEDGRIEEMLTNYEGVLRQQLAMRREERRRRKDFPDRTEKERCIWEGIYDNLQLALEAELQWTAQLGKKLGELQAEEE